MNSCLYSGTVRHRRLAPTAHAFSYRVFMMYLDLDELPEVFDGHWLWSARRPALAWFRRADYLGDARQPLADAVRAEAERQTGSRPEGPIRVLTNLRYYGHAMNPVSLYYCFEKGGKRVETILAEVTNTPWGERHIYALGPGPDDPTTGSRHRLEKAFHVSPFMGMDHDYEWCFGQPGDRLTVHMENALEGKKVFDATLVLLRQEITTANCAGALVRHPWMTARVSVAIYWQAARLWLKGTPFYTHPSKHTA
ncbi:MAG: DUF1365 family protein [Myxococcota bacterium]